MKSSNQTLEGILHSGNQYVIPLFQRYYRWGPREWERLWEDLLALQQPEKTGKHFMGFLVLVPETPTPDKVTSYQVIDGQQRLLTLSLILCAMRDAAATASWRRLADEIMQNYVVHHFKKGREYFRVYPRQSDAADYFGVVNCEGTSTGQIGEAYRYFTDKIGSLPDADTESGLRAFLGIVSHQLEFVHATLEGENAYNIFKSLNSTGIPLGQGDLIRNFMFMHLPAGAHEEFDEQIWRPIEQRFEGGSGDLDADLFSAFFRDFLMQSGDYIRPRETSEKFQERYAATEFDPGKVGRELKTASERYAVIIGQARDPDPGVQDALKSLRQLDSSTTYPLLLNLSQRRAQGDVSDRDFEEAVGILAGFILRRLVCQDSSRGYGRMLAQACVHLKEAPLEDLRRYLQARGHPDTPRFGEAFSRFNLYESRYARPIMVSLERAEGHKEPADLSQTQLEHIMPQTLSDEWREDLGPEADRIYAAWLHTPGNLTLSAYNPELRNSRFAVKRQEYEGSNVVITRRLAEYTSWGEEQIRARGRQLAEAAARIWTGPASPPARAHELQLRYWIKFCEYLIESRGKLLPKRVPMGRSINVATGRSGYTYIAYADAREGWIGVSIYMGGKRAKEQFQELIEAKNKIEQELGLSPLWDSPPERRHGEILVRREADLADRSQWQDYFEWTREHLELYDRVFGPRIRRRKERSDRRQLQLAFWECFHDFLLVRHSFVKPRKPSAQHWMDFAIGSSLGHLYAVVDVPGREVRCHLTLTTTDAKQHFSVLHKAKVEIEKEFGSALDWRQLPQRKESHVVLTKTGAVLTDREQWPALQEWLAEKLEAFRRVFEPRLKQLRQAGRRQLSEGTAEGDDG